ncbi:hypothetical protein [Helcococcus kunzii]|uniref:hypothetical protein n=1 Tax=Helcococcus kunzii TaxID=40091 RepID=UPI001BAEDF2E|nr:hypothetical protein [Helcococcus kunzii]QUY65214.1 hypothetical protein GUI37_06635 [Helcococcus kunzii]QZO75875.1 hypothetical protein HIF96_06200 [Helcococcus kunzii]
MENIIKNKSIFEKYKSEFIKKNYQLNKGLRFIRRRAIVEPLVFILVNCLIVFFNNLNFLIVTAILSTLVIIVSSNYVSKKDKIISKKVLSDYFNLDTRYNSERNKKIIKFILENRDIIIGKNDISYRIMDKLINHGYPYLIITTITFCFNIIINLIQKTDPFHISEQSGKFVFFVIYIISILVIIYNTIIFSFTEKLYYSNLFSITINELYLDINLYEEYNKENIKKHMNKKTYLSSKTKRAIAKGTEKRRFIIIEKIIN